MVNASNGFKFCPKCSSIKPISEFHINKTKSDGLCVYCKICKNSQEIKYRLENKERVNKRKREIYNPEKKKEYAIKNRDKILIYYKNRYIKNKERILRRNKEYRKRNKEKIKEMNALYIKKNKEKIKKRQKEYYQKNKDRFKKYHLEHRDEILEKQRVYHEKNKGKIAIRKKQYIQRLYVKKAMIIKTNKRKRELGFFELLPNFFPEDVIVTFHHINNLMVIPIPRLSHKSFNSQSRLDHRNNCNDYLQKLYLIDFGRLGV